MPLEIPDLPPLWTAPAPIGHNGGPVLEPRPPGRPSISTSELRDRILDLLGEGIPLRVICRTEGVPSRETVYRWRRSDPAFDRMCIFAQEQGYIDMAERVVAEVDQVLERRGVAWARLVFNWRREQLARMNPAYFGGKDMKF